MKISHPSFKDYTLNFESLIGPENAVFFRGRITGKTEIIIPSYWKDLVDYSSISVHLTYIGAHQNVIVKRIDENKVYLQAYGNMPIDCYYLLVAERVDVPKFEVEQRVDTGT